MPNNTVVLTGGTGFIGQWVIEELLKQQFDIIALIPPGETIKKQAGVTPYELDLFDFNKMQQFFKEFSGTHLLHLAWNTEHGKYWTATNNLDWVGSSLKMVALAKEAGIQRIVCAGSCAEYDWTSPSPYKELDSPIVPKTLYGVCKNATREVMETICAQGNLSFAWGRIFFLYGPGENAQRLIPYVISQLLKNEIAELSEGNQIRDFSFVQDVAAALVALLVSEVQGPVNIATGQGHSLREVTTLIAQKLNKPHLLAFGQKANNPNEPDDLIGVAHRLQQEVGYTPQTSLSEGLDKTIAWWQSQL